MTTSDQSPSAELLVQVCEAVDSFETAWQAVANGAKPPRIEEVIRDIPEAHQPAFLRELLAVELECRLQFGELPKAAEYLSRLPQHAQVVEAAVREVELTGRAPAAPLAGNQRTVSPLEALKKLERFEIRRELGRGAFGTVYLAYDPQLQREVAIKVPHEKAMASDPGGRRFLREARSAANLQHANICPVYEVGTVGERNYIVMAFIDGNPLSKVLGSGAKLSERQVVSAIRKIALALQEAHEKGIIHRDLKPANIMINRKGEPIVMDFGLARRDNPTEAQISVSGQIMGSPAYMSPEQARGLSKSVGPQADVYSLGILMYAMLCGRLPFLGSVTEVLGLILHVEPDPPSQHRPGLDPNVESVCLQAIAKDPKQRFASMKQFAAALSNCLKKTSISNSELAKTQSWNVPVTAAESSSKHVKRNSLAAETDHAHEAGETQRLARIVDAVSADVEAVVERSLERATPATTIPTFLLYLVPVMGALVLGGAYFGIQALRKQVSNAQPLIVEVPASHSTSTNQPPNIQRDNDSSSTLTDESTQNGNAQPAVSADSSNVSAAENETATSEPSEKTAAPSLKPKPLPTAEVAKVDPQPAPGSTLKPQPPTREPKTWRVGKGDGAVANVSEIWDQLISGDQIRVSTSAPLEVPPLQQGDKHLIIAAEGNTRPILHLQLPASPQNGQGLWKIDQGSLMLTGVDLYVDLTDRKLADPEVVLFELNESDLHLVNTTITVMRGRVEGRSPVTAVKLVGERSWDKTAKGNPPQPVQLELQNCMIRGAKTVVFVDSRQASLRLENSIVALPGTLIHLFHARPLEFAHQAVSIEVAGCTLDTNGPLLMVDTRPFDLHPVKADITIRGSMICSGIVATSDMPPQVMWQSPVDDVVSTSVKWFGHENCYLNRADCFKAKTASGPIASLVRTPDDWARQNFGQEVDWFAPATQSIKLPREPWHQRLPNDYPHPSQIARLRRTAGGSQIRVGAEPKDVAVPRVFRK